MLREEDRVRRWDCEGSWIISPEIESGWQCVLVNGEKGKLSTAVEERAANEGQIWEMNTNSKDI
jgi:hypothetical protein